MEIQVVEKKELKVVGLSWNGSYSQASEIPQLFKEMEQRLGEVSHHTNEQMLVAPFHSRETEFTYYVTTPVEEIAELPDGMVGFTIPRKNYVFTTHIGNPQEVENTYLQMFTWMKEYGYEQDHGALSMEVYKEEHKHLISTGNLHFDIYIPVRTYKEYL